MEITIAQSKATVIILQVYWLSQILIWQRHPLHWKLKILMFHMVMFLRHLIYEVHKFLKRETVLMWFLLFDPIIPVKEFLVYGEVHQSQSLASCLLKPEKILFIQGTYIGQINSTTQTQSNNSISFNHFQRTGWY